MPRNIYVSKNFVKVLLYADELVVPEYSKFQMHQILAELHTAAMELGLKVSLTKMKAIKFKRGSRMVSFDIH